MNNAIVQTCRIYILMQAVIRSVDYLLHQSISDDIACWAPSPLEEITTVWPWIFIPCACGVVGIIAVLCKGIISSHVEWLAHATLCGSYAALTCSAISYTFAHSFGYSAVTQLAGLTVLHGLFAIHISEKIRIIEGLQEAIACIKPSYHLK